MRAVRFTGEERFQFWLKILGSSLFVLIGFSALVFAGGKAGGGRYEVFDAPNSSYTYPTGINDRGEVTGYFFEADHRIRAFVRRSGGLIDVFDAVPGGTETEPVGINNRGEVGGGGFLRDSGGHITLFSVPGALPGRTFASGMNDRGSITGKFIDDVLPLEHGYVRDQRGQFAKFDIPNGSYLQVAGINARGDVGGTFDDWTESGKQRIFVRDARGTFTILDVPHGTPWVSGINNSGEIAGMYVLPSTEGGEIFGFFRDQRGTLVDLGIPNPDVTGLNNQGEVVGIFSNPEKDGKTCGFIWSPQGNTTILDYPNAAATYAYSVNDRGQVAGAFDVAGAGSQRRGFVYTEF